MKKLIVTCPVIGSLLTLQYCRNDDREKVNGDDSHSSARPQKPVKMIDYLVGEWKIDSVKRGEKNPEGAGDSDRTLTFTNEARYILRSGNRKIDSGACRMNEQLKNLYFESEANQKPREYEVRVKEDTLVLTSKDDQDETVYMYSRN